MAEPEHWYWDLNKNCAVRAAERGPGSDTLGPYGSKAEAEHWRAKVEERNETWEEADDDWENPDDDDE
jgi:hypothetical protein